MEYITAGRLKAAFHRGRYVMYEEQASSLCFLNSIRTSGRPETVRLEREYTVHAEPYTPYSFIALAAWASTTL